MGSRKAKAESGKPRGASISHIMTSSMPTKHQESLSYADGFGAVSWFGPSVCATRIAQTSRHRSGTQYDGCPPAGFTLGPSGAFPWRGVGMSRSAVRPESFLRHGAGGNDASRQDDLLFLLMQVTKVYASNDGVAPPNRTLANKGLLPANTKWVEVKGGNHSQFGHYGHQLFDGTASETQQATTRVLLEALTEAIK